MPSSLATQLIQNASLNAALLSTTRRKPESYIFPSSQASTHDIESIHFIASNAFLQLTSVQPSCRKYEGALFSDAVKDVDRTLLSKDKDEELDEQLRGFMRLLGPWLMEGMVGKILEWLVRRFRYAIQVAIHLNYQRVMAGLTNLTAKTYWPCSYLTTILRTSQRCLVSYT